MSTSYKGPRAAAKASASASRAASQETINSGSGLSNGTGKQRLSTSKPDLTKYAKYLDGDSSKFDETQYKPTIRAERHQVGYSAALNQRRNRTNGDNAAGANEDLGHRRRPANRAHIRSYSLNRTAGGGGGGDTASVPNYQKNTEASANRRQRSRLGEDLPFKSRISKEDVLVEEKISTPPRTGLSSDAFPTRDKLSSSSSNSEETETSIPFSEKMADGTSSEASKSSRAGNDGADRFRSRSRNSATNSVPVTESKDRKAFKAPSTKEPGKKFFPSFDEYDAPKFSTNNTEQVSSTPKSGAKSGSVFGDDLFQEKAEPRKTFLSPEPSWNAKYFPSPYGPSGAQTNHYGSRLDASSGSESPLGQDQETEFKRSPRPSYRNGLFEHLRSQESRRSHSLDSRNRTPNRERSTPSPSPLSTKSRRSRTDQMNSLNESNFESKSAFKDHLLNLTMNKDEYEDLMSDFKNGSIIEDLDAVGVEHQPNDVLPDIVVDEVNDISDEVDLQSDNKSNNSPKQSNDAITEQEAVPLRESSDNTVNKEIATDVPDSACPKSEQEDPAVHPETNEVRNSKEEMGKDDDNRSSSEKESSGSYFRLLEELIQAARAKYSSPDMCKSSECQVILEPVLSEELTHKWRFQKTEFGIPTSMGVTSDGCVVVADYGNSCLEYFNAAGDFEHKIEGVKPFGIVVNKKDQIIVGDRRGKAIRIFDKFGADVAQWESKTFGWISGIAQLQNGHLVICDRDRFKVGIYTEGGQIISEFGSYGVNNSQLCMADFLAVDSKGRIIVADSGNHCLKLFDTSGKAIGKIGSRGVDDGCLEWPKGICVDRNDNIIVADMHNNRISMFSTSGDFVQQLLSMTPNPYNVCYGLEAGLLGTLHYTLKGFSQYDVYTF